MAEQVVTKETSKQFTLDWKDIAKGFLMAAIGAVISPIIESLNAGGLTAGLGYLIKNFFQPSQTVIKITPPIEEKKQ